MWVLVLNDMRASNVENTQPRFRADTKEQLIALLETEKVDPYRDDQWGKNYRKGGSLEWMNPPWSAEEGEHLVNVGNEDSWAAGARQRYQQEVMSIPIAPA